MNEVLKNTKPLVVLDTNTEKRYYKWVPWTRPNLTSNTSYGRLIGQSEHTVSKVGTRYYYRMFDGSLGNSEINHWGPSNSVVSWWAWELPVKLKVFKLVVHTVDYYATNDFLITGTFYSDRQKTHTLGSIDIKERNQQIAIDIPNGIEVTTLYFEKTGGYAYGGIKEIEIEADTLMEVDGSGEYDFVVEHPIYQCAFKPKTKTLYYKRQFVSWNQPILTSNTSDPTFKVSASAVESATYAAWKSFKGTVNAEACIKSYKASASNPWWYQIQTANKLKWQSVLMKNRSGMDAGYAGAFKKFVIQGSDDGVSWVNITPELTNTNNTNGSTWTIIVNSQTAYYYHRFFVTDSCSSNRTSLGYPTITAVQEQIELSNASDYDFVDTVTEGTAAFAYTEPEKRYLKSGEPNVMTTGSLIVSDGIVSGYTNTAHATLYKKFEPSKYNTWKIQVKAKATSFANECRILGTAVDHTGIHNPLYTTGLMSFYLSSNGSTWDIASDLRIGTTPLPLDKWIYLVFEFTGSQYRAYWHEEGSQELVLVTVDSTAKMCPCMFCFGGMDYSTAVLGFLGEIDFKECFIEADGKIWWKGTRPMECSEEEAEWSEWINIDKPIN